MQPAAALTKSSSPLSKSPPTLIAARRKIEGKRIFGCISKCSSSSADPGAAFGALYEGEGMLKRLRLVAVRPPFYCTECGCTTQSTLSLPLQIDANSDGDVSWSEFTTFMLHEDDGSGAGPSEAAGDVTSRFVPHAARTIHTWTEIAIFSPAVISESQVFMVIPSSSSGNWSAQALTQSPPGVDPSLHPYWETMTTTPIEHLWRCYTQPQCAIDCQQAPPRGERMK